MNYRPLEDSFVSKGFTYKKLVREGLYAIYEVSKPGFVYKTFEAVRIKLNKGGECYGKKIEPYEGYPSDTQFGQNAFSCPTQKQAINRLVELKQHYSNLKDKQENPVEKKEYVLKYKNVSKGSWLIKWKNCIKCNKQIKTMEYNKGGGICENCC